MRTIEEITSAMTALVDGAADRSLTDDEVGQYEALETELQQTQRSEAIRTRNAAYNTVTFPAGVPSGGRPNPDGRTDEDRAFENYLRTGRPNADISHLQNAQGTGTSAGGGYLVPTRMREKLVETMLKFGGFAPLAETITTTDAGPLQWMNLDDTANQGDISAEHAAPASGADLAFTKSELGAYRYTTAGAGSNLPVRVSTRLIADAAFDIEGMVARALGTRIGRRQAQHWITGTGVGEPQGIVADNITQDNDLDTADTPDYEDLVDTLDALEEAYEDGSTWVMRKNTWSQLRLIIDMNGRPILQDALSGIDGAPRKMLLNYPVVTVPEMPLLSSAGITKPIAFGNFRRAYVIRYVGAPSILVNPYSRMQYGEIEYTGEQWADGLVQERAAYVVTRNNT
jgi:HK97 family phage major capsid protein